jgi:hypothetical protein
MQLGRAGGVGYLPHELHSCGHPLHHWVSMLRSLRVFAINALIGGAMFWLPDLLLSAVFRKGADLGFLCLVTVVCPTSFMWAYRSALRRMKPPWPRLPIALPLLVGVFLLGPVSMTTAAGLKGGTGFKEVQGWNGVLEMMVFTVSPWYTLIMSVYDLTAFALVLAFAVAITGYYVFERKARMSGEWPSIRGQALSSNSSPGDA